MIDAVFIAYGLIAASISVVVSSVELISKYQNRNFGDIFTSRYYILFAFLNASSCFAVYYLIPYIGGIMIKPEILSTISEPLKRAVIAGLGYSFLVRTKILDISLKGYTIGIGFGGVYDAISGYLLRHLDCEIQDRMRNEFFDIWDNLTKNPCVYLGVIKLIASQRDSAERYVIENKVSRLKEGEPEAFEFCLFIYVG